MTKPRRRPLRSVALACSATVLLGAAGCAREPRREVVVYTALDRIFSEPILDGFETGTGIKVRVKYDTEATKTIGLVNTLRAERNRPRCDVFWNNEIVNTVRLRNEGLLAPCRPAAAAAFPPVFRDREGYWYGFAGRARVLLVNTNLVPAAREPRSIRSLADPSWRGRTGIAKPLFGTTATHAACLFAHLGRKKAENLLRSIRDNEVRVESGNKTVALNVAAGRLAFGLTDTDDAIGEVENGKPVKIVYPDAEPGEMGVLFIPNTLAMVKDCPNPRAALALIEYLLSPEVEAALATGKSAQIPLNPGVSTETRVKSPNDVNAMEVDFGQAAAQFAEAATFIEEYFLE